MSRNRAALVGAFVVGGVLLFSLGLFWIGDRRLMFSESVTLAAEFANMSGLRVGSKVMVAGMDAGEVLAIRVPVRPEAKFRVEFRVLDQFRPILRTDSVASIQVEGLVGSKVLQIDPGTDEAPLAAPGATIRSREPVEIEAVVRSAVDTIGRVNSAVDEIQGRVVKAVDVLTDVGEQANEVVGAVGADAGKLFATGRQIVEDVNTVVDGVRQGRGTIGKLVTDDEMYKSVRAAVDEVRSTSVNTRRISDDAREIVADLKSRNVGEHVEKAAENLQQATAEVRDIMAELRPSGAGERGLLEDIRSTLDNTREATADLAENMEALKRNWFFRGFFSSRGFYDVDSLSRDDYLKGNFARERPRERTWVPLQDAFIPDPTGGEMLSEAGMRKLGEIIAPYLRFAPNTLMMIEGYASAGSELEQFLASRDRAQIVRQYLVDRFGLDGKYVGAMPMGGVRSEGAGELWDGVAVVYFPEKRGKK
jgi:phospholipid/cholesterol/gamma-HCH transport system substrate-binding protein